MKAILAMTPNGGIGLNNQLPWDSLEGDLKRFKELTTGQTIVMGRSTWESLPKKPLPNRKSVVISSSVLDLPEGVEQIRAIEDIPEDAWIIGGAKLFGSTIQLISEMHLTVSKHQYKTDAKIDISFLKDFHLVHFENLSDNTYSILKRNATTP
jgi:dihydrofolate reductase